MPHSLILYVPFDFGFELDSRALLDPATGSSASARLEAIARGLSDGVPGWSFAVASSRSDDELGAYGGEQYRAPSARPPYLCSGDLESNVPAWVAFDERGAKHALELEGANMTLQDYGIGVLELSYRVTERAVQHPPAVFAQNLCELCDDRRLREQLVECAQTVCRALYRLSTRTKQPFADDTTSLVHRDPNRTSGESAPIQLKWFHSLLIVDNRDGAYGELGGSEWREKLHASGVLPSTPEFFSDAFSFKCVQGHPFVTRRVEATALFGWGNSLLALRRGNPKTPCDELIPIRYVMRILQSYSSGLYHLNSDLVAQILDNLHGGRRKRYAEYRDHAQRADTLRFRAHVFLSLMAEQRYAHSAHEQALWDAANEAWQTDALTHSLRANLDLLHRVYEKKRAFLDERVRAKLTNLVSLITIASAAAVGFEIIDTLQEGPDFEKLAYQGGVVALLLIVGVLVLFIPPGRA